MLDHHTNTTFTQPDETLIDLLRSVIHHNSGSAAKLSNLINLQKQATPRNLLKQYILPSVYGQSSQNIQRRSTLLPSLKFSTRKPTSDSFALYQVLFKETTNIEDRKYSFKLNHDGIVKLLDERLSHYLSEDAVDLKFWLKWQNAKETAKLDMDNLGGYDEFASTAISYVHLGSLINDFLHHESNFQNIAFDSPRSPRDVEYRLAPDRGSGTGDFSLATIDNKSSSKKGVTILASGENKPKLSYTRQGRLAQYGEEGYNICKESEEDRFTSNKKLLPCETDMHIQIIDQFYANKTRWLVHQGHSAFTIWYHAGPASVIMTRPIPNNSIETDELNLASTLVALALPEVNVSNAEARCLGNEPIPLVFRFTPNSAQDNPSAQLHRNVSAQSRKREPILSAEELKEQKELVAAEIASLGGNVTLSDEEESETELGAAISDGHTSSRTVKTARKVTSTSIPMPDVDRSADMDVDYSSTGTSLTDQNSLDDNHQVNDFNKSMGRFDGNGIKETKDFNETNLVYGFDDEAANSRNNAMIDPQSRHEEVASTTDTDEMTGPSAGSDHDGDSMDIDTPRLPEIPPEQAGSDIQIDQAADDSVITAFSHHGAALASWVTQIPFPFFYGKTPTITLTRRQGLFSSTYVPYRFVKEEWGTNSFGGYRKITTGQLKHQETNNKVNIVVQWALKNAMEDKWQALEARGEIHSRINRLAPNSQHFPVYYGLYEGERGDTRFLALIIKDIRTIQIRKNSRGESASDLTDSQKGSIVTAFSILHAEHITYNNHHCIDLDREDPNSIARLYDLSNAKSGASVQETNNEMQLVKEKFSIRD
ncbi:uncharacterized protein L201_001432 [Kwoniella dendrophila CBS 6074]|uniref:Protein kinase domain-containing protein n=1 Tax=Kwoniella dendrophila CBS 6074 TaxID=1295534 RepID=A0AAX4JPT4_9TREE